MYQKVLVPLDKSRESEGVLDAMSELVNPEGEAILLNISPPRRSTWMGEFVLLGSQQEEGDRNIAIDYLRSAAKQLAESSVKSRCEVTVSDSVAEGIVKFAEQENADLIAMFTQDRKGLARLVKGSVAKEVQRRATTQVRVFGPGDLAEQPAALARDSEASRTDTFVFKDVDVFQGLSDEQVNRVVALGSRLQISAGETLGKGGELGQKLFVIVEGEANLTAHSEIGEIAVRVAGRGESFPLAVLLGEGTLITSGEALTDMDLLEIPRTRLLQLCSEDPSFGTRMYAAIAQLFANRYNATLTHLSISVERELRHADI